MKNTILSLLSASAIGVLGTGALAQIFQNDDVSIGGYLCVGPECTENEPFNTTDAEVFSMEGDRLRIRFSDTSTSGGSFPASDWRIDINDLANGGANYFAIGDVNQNTQPFKINNNAPHHALFIDNNGQIGFGTSNPGRPLHVIAPDKPALRLEQDGTQLPAIVWDISANHNNLSIFNSTAIRQPVIIEDGAANSSLVLKDGGAVGLGTFTPEGKLHVQGSGVQLAYFESSNGGPVQIRMRSNSQNRRFLAVNNANEVKSQIIFGDNDIRFTGATDSGANRWLTIGPTGIISQGPTCSGAPCDRTFDPEFFEVPSIEERAAYMWDNMHLPAVGPTSPDAPFNLTEKAGGMLHELEVAHIYIEQLNTKLKLQAEQHDATETALRTELNAILARLAVLEAR